MIKTLEERPAALYVPSPGVIYPALTYLEETGLAEVENDGAKKLYKITETGRQKVEDNRAAIDQTLASWSALPRAWPSSTVCSTQISLRVDG